MRQNKRKVHFKKIYKTLMGLEQLEWNRVKKTTSLNFINVPVSGETVFSVV